MITPTLPGIELARPPLDQDVIAEGVRAWAKSYSRSEDEIESVIRCFELHIDGYELAKELERCELWDITAMDVDALDAVSSHVDTAYRALCMEWVKANNVQPSLAIGTRITSRHVRGGVITGVCTYSPAHYLVKEDDCTEHTRRALVRFEDAKASEVPA